MTTKRPENPSTTLIDRLVARGRRIEEEGAERVRSVTGDVRGQLAERLDAVEAAIEDSVRRMLERARIPTREELGRLEERIDALGGMVRELEEEERRTPSAERVYHVAPHPDGGWKIEAEDAERASEVHRTKAEAVGSARGLAERNAPARLVIHRSDGTIQEHRSYD